MPTAFDAFPRTSQGGPYQRRIAELEAVAPGVFGPGTRFWTNVASSLGQAGGVRVTGVQKDATTGAMVYDPGHPDADKNGYVRLPNINPTEELMDMGDARDGFSANMTVYQAIRAMLGKAVKL